MKKGGLDPKKLPAISYCKEHRYHTNLHPSCLGNIMGTYCIVCPDCGASNMRSRCKTVVAAIKDWNKKFGVCAK